jgi:hypothetical protein
MEWVPFVLLAAAVAACSWFAWISLQSLLQARLLFRLDRLPLREPDKFGRQAFYGRVTVARAVQAGFGDLLWCRTEVQVYRRRSKSSGWRTESTVTQTADFQVQAHVGPVRLAGHPTEVQGLQSRTEVHDRTGWFGLGHGHGDRRTVYTYLPVCAYVTVVGRHQSRDVVEADNKLGLLLSPNDPGKAAWIETAKGLGGLALVTALLACALMFYSSNVRRG